MAGWDILFSIMTTYKAAQFGQKNGKLELVDKQIPKPGPGEVVVKMEACGVCHSDSFTEVGAYGNSFPRVPGHEIVGTVYDVGSDVPKEFKKGVRVGSGWNGGYCGQCKQCRCGNFSTCGENFVNGITFDGGYQEYAILRQEALCFVPDGMDPAEAAPLLCAGITVYNSMRHVDHIMPGDMCVVKGIGGLGHLAIQFSNKFGYKTVAVSSGSKKKDLAMKLGTHEYIDSSAENAVDKIQKMGGAKMIVVTAIGGDVEGMVNALGLDGTMLIVAVITEPVKVNTLHLLQCRAAVKGWLSGSACDSQDCLNFAQLTQCRPMIQKYPLKDAQKAYDAMMKGEARFRSVLVFE
ncbi:hypothetical protein BZG36_03066 [Bifiguratus adelaidae]|uniref:Enoyl reductase (ER) domain-containing protein n=1 Tax=Bifiguratus adelaidae TaxID=1938954 RepID=A0A261XZF8_9FUNG|nr:hypothetical protein BZG36_03066 [Bifiguratus adelaidae]